jgi:hypothetical protein
MSVKNDDLLFPQNSLLSQNSLVPCFEGDLKPYPVFAERNLVGRYHKPRRICCVANMHAIPQEFSFHRE